MDGTTIDPSITLVVALISGAALVVGPVLVALINRGPKAQTQQPAALDPDRVMPRSEYDGLLSRMAELDDELRDAHRREELVRDERDKFYARAIRAESALARHGIDWQESS